MPGSIGRRIFTPPDALTGAGHAKLVADEPDMKNFLFFIDSLSTWVGKSFAWLIMVLTLGVSYEVLVRYAFRAPTTWAFDFSYINYGAMFLMAGAYTLSRGGHVRADVLYRFFSPRRQASLDLVLYIIFFLPAVIALIYSGWNYAATSIRFKEVSIFSPAGIPIFPLKALIPATGVFLLLQGIAEIIRCIICIREGSWPQRLHDVEETESIVIRELQHQEQQGQTPQNSGRGA
jgi:TRAP-type mannitol/chloroaromatic compound transport system permease small subunit